MIDIFFFVVFINKILKLDNFAKFYNESKFVIFQKLFNSIIINIFYINNNYRF